VTAVVAEPGRRRRALPARVTGVLAVVGLVVVWELLTALLAPGSKIWPTPWHIATTIHHDGWHFYWPNVRTTLWESARGFVYGNVVAILLAILAVTVPVLEGPLTQLGVISYCLPIVAIGSIFAIVFQGETSKVILAAMAVFFTTFVGTVLGLRSASRASLDVVRAYGGGTLAQLRRVRLMASLPSLFAALKIAGPAAVLGAMIGEYLGQQDSGIGQAMVASQQSFNTARTWGLALVATVLGGIVFVVIGLVGRRTTGWATAGSR
jgi:ABC-type nitrate/sulfonate/bicarbonate transport system permease component